MSRKVGFEPVTFGTTAGHPTADLGINLGAVGDRRTILLSMTYDPTDWKSTWTGARTRSSWVDPLSRQMTEIIELRNMADAEDSYA